MRHLVAALSLLIATPAAAEDVVVLSVGGDAPESEARVAREAVAAALEADGLSVLPEADVALRLPPARLRACADTDCAWALGRELEVSMVAAVATWSGEPGSLTVSLLVGPERSHTATEEIGDGGLAAAARAAVVGAQSSRRRALMVEGTSAAPSEDRETAIDREIEPTSPLTQERSLEEWILPSLLGVVGLALVGVSVYALLEPQCDLRGESSGICLRGSNPNIGLGVVLALVGGLSVGGAILWLIVGGQPMEVGNIDVVIGPGNVAVRGTF